MFLTNALGQLFHIRHAHVPQDQLRSLVFLVLILEEEEEEEEEEQLCGKGCLNIS